MVSKCALSVCMLRFVSFREPQSSLATEIVTGFTRRTLVNDTDGETIDAFIANLENDNTDV